MVKTSSIKHDCNNTISIDPYSKYVIDETKPDQKHKFIDVVNSVKITKKSDKKREHLIMCSTKKSERHEAYAGLSDI